MIGRSSTGSTPGGGWVLNDQTDRPSSSWVRHTLYHHVLISEEPKSWPSHTVDIHTVLHYVQVHTMVTGTQWDGTH